MLSFVRGLFGLIPSEVNSYTVSEWATEKRFIPSGQSSRAGPWHWRVTPYMKEIADCLSESSSVREVAIMKGARVGYTAALIENHIGYMIDKCPGSAILVSATKEMAIQMAELRIDPMLEYAGLADKVFSQSKKKANKKKGDTKIKKEFPGGYLLIGGPSGHFLRGNGAQYLYLDEIDEWKLQIGGADKKKSVTANQGDPISLARRRSAEYENHKILYGSTPLDESTSKIKSLFEEGDMCYYWVPCSKCGTMQILRWQDETREGDDRFRMKYKTDDAGRLIPESVYYECENKNCRHPWGNADKDTFLELGEWRPSARPKTAHFRSFHISSLYSLVQPWVDVCQEWIKAKQSQGALRSFINTFLGETWKEKGDAPIAKKVYESREGYDVGTLPKSAKVLFVTIGADVQEDRIECEVVGWGRGLESWSIEYLVLSGDTSDLEGLAWQQFQNVIQSPHAGLSGDLAFIDSRFRTVLVRDFCEPYVGGVFPIMGRQSLRADQSGNRIYSLFTDPSYTKPVVHLNTTDLKLEVYRNLKRGTRTGDAPDRPFPGYCHFPRGTDSDPKKGYSREYFDHLMSEDLITVQIPGGGTAKRWEQHGRNEPLDARAYALGAAYVLKGDWAKTRTDDDEDAPVEWSDFWDSFEARKGA